MKLPPSQQLVAADKWPLVGERSAAAGPAEWSIRIDGHVERPVSLSLDELRQLPRIERIVDIHCVTRWSKPGVTFAGTRLADLVALARPSGEANFISFLARSQRDHSTSLPLDDALALETLVAWEAQGRPLEAEHGGPVRIVVPRRYFYKSLKWLARVELLATDRLGYWEATAGYHNVADPWQEQRYMAPGLSKSQMRDILDSREISGRDLRSLAAAGAELDGLQARDALLRDADFRGARLVGACFQRANLSNAHFASADLSRASFLSADVEGADFAGADLRGADFRGASLVGVSFRDQTAAARIDETTRFDPGAADQLTPLEAEFLRSVWPGS